MKRIIGLLFILLFFGKTSAQKVDVNIVTTGYHGDVHVFDPAVNYDPKNFISVIHLDRNGAGTYTADLSKPRYIVLYFTLPGNIDFHYTLYLSRGDNLFFNAKFSNNVPVITVTGKGSNNNQPEIFALTNIDIFRFKNDKTPDRAIAAIKSQEARNTIILKQYINQYKPSPDFVKNAQLNCEYFALSTYYEFYCGKFRSPETDPDYKKWQNIKDSLLAKHPINNDAALTAFNYEHFLALFILQEPPVLMSQAKTLPASFYKAWYHTTVEKGKKTYAAESRNLFIERMINKYFSGKTAELAYAEMLRIHFRFSHYDDLDLVLNHFKRRYLSSRYVPAFNAAMTEVTAKKTRTLNNNIIFVSNNGTKLNTLEDVLQLMKGKTVFVDMWGTWCSPCLSELEKYAPQIRAHFKGKNITFLYIANKDIAHEGAWKKAIAYYKIYGTHILANDQLDKDIMTKIKASGYPTHFIIKKNGSFKKVKTQDGSQTQQMIKEIQAEL